ncbi:YecA family protein [Clostridium massiliamazoniense]|uniref:YecA family protein n=1 Tax=Clostridium massiliamazoniense TaxID=1347366 RepID=UPI0006D81A1A|nr:SEC-C metal-binding domain-containing protein [Clostridium massiliamazoniense]
MEDKLRSTIEEIEEKAEQAVEGMMEALEKMAKERKSKAQKRKITNDLETILKACTRDELKDILSTLGIKFKASDKKDNLINTVIENYKSAVTEIFKKIDSTVYEELQILLMNNGVLDKKIDKTFKDNSYLEKLGMLFLASDEEKNIYLIAPTEVLEAIKEINKKDLEKNDRIVNLFRGMTYYYGLISLDEFIANIPAEENLNEEDVRLLFMMLEDINKDGLYVDNKWKSEYLEYSVDFENLLESENLQNEEFKKLTSNELLKASEKFYVGNKKIYMPLINVVKEYYEAPEEALEQMKQEIYMYSQMHSEEELKTFILSKIKPQAEIKMKFSDALHKVYTRIPLWKYRGFTELEKFSPEIRVVKVGRNDPCPCGSGKKYKKCCGK